jgi:hypothetical protein
MCKIQFLIFAVALPVSIAGAQTVQEQHGSSSHLAACPLLN